MSNKPTNRILGPTTPPQMQDIFNANNANLLSSINCVKIGKISSYNPLLNTAEVVIQAQVELTDGRIFDYPLVTDCPVFKLQGGTAFLSMPILPDDPCLILFNDIDIDNWFLTNAAVLPSSSRKHSLSDGLVLVGINNLINVTPSLPGIVELFAGTNLLALGNAVISLKKIMDDLIDVIAAITVQGPSVYPLTAASIAAIEAMKVEVALLLDKGSAPV